MELKRNGFAEPEANDGIGNVDDRSCCFSRGWICACALALTAGLCADEKISFNGTFGTKGEYDGQEFTRDRIVNSGWTTSKSGASTSSLLDAAHWSDGEAPSSAKDYMIAGGNGRVATISGDIVFGGKSLTLGDESNPGWLAPSKTSSLTFGNDGLFIRKGGVVWQNFTYGSPKVTGKVTVSAPASSPAVFWSHWAQYSTYTLNFTELVGEAGCGIKFARQTDTANDSCALVLSGDWTGYNGDFIIDGNYAPQFNDIECPGALVLNGSGEKSALSGGGAEKTGSFKFRSIKLNSTLPVKLGVGETGNATMTTDALTVSGDGKVALSIIFGAVPRTQYPLQLADPPRKAVLVDLPAAAKPILETFALSIDVPSSWTSEEKAYARYRSCMAIDLKEEADADRRKLVCVIPKCTYCTASGKNNDLLMDHPEYWEGVESGKGFEPDTAYFVFGDSTIALTRAKEIEFAGKTLCLMGGYVSTGGKMTFDDLRIMPPVRLQYASSSHIHEFNGNITVYDRKDNGVAAPIQLWSERNYAMTVNSRLHGKGQVLIDSPNWSAEEKQANRTVVFTGDNSGYAGKIALANYADGYKTTLKITDGKALGGVLDAFTHDAVKLRNRAVLEVGATTSLSEPTRGILAESGSSICVLDEGDVFTVDSALTCTGTVTKSGNGVLALKKAVAKGDESELFVSSGALQATVSDALQDIDVRFAAGACLRFDADVADGDIAMKGLDIDGFAMSFDDARLDVVCSTVNDVSAMLKKTLTLFTGFAESIEKLVGSIRVRLVDGKGRHRRGTLKVEDSVESGRKTIRASFDVNGLVVVVK